MNCLIIAGAPEYDIDLIKEQSQKSDLIICADKGYTYAKIAGVKPDIVIGDFDSCTDEVSGDFETVKLNTDKDFTDTHICVDKALETGCKEITILFAVGGRLDHTLANLYLLGYIANKGGRGVLLSKKERIELLTKGKTVFSGMGSLTFSVFPFGCDRVTLSIKGAKYELDDYIMKSNVPIGVSNLFDSDDCEIEITDGRALVIINLNNEFL